MQPLAPATGREPWCSLRIWCFVWCGWTVWRWILAWAFVTKPRSGARSFSFWREVNTFCAMTAMTTPTTRPSVPFSAFLHGRFPWKFCCDFPRFVWSWMPSASQEHYKLLRWQFSGSDVWVCWGCKEVWWLKVQPWPRAKEVRSGSWCYCWWAIWDLWPICRTSLATMLQWVRVNPQRGSRHWPFWESCKRNNYNWTQRCTAMPWRPEWTVCGRTVWHSSRASQLVLMVLRCQTHRPLMQWSIVVPKWMVGMQPFIGSGGCDMTCSAGSWFWRLVPEATSPIGCYRPRRCWQSSWRLSCPKSGKAMESTSWRDFKSRNLAKAGRVWGSCFTWVTRCRAYVLPGWLNGRVGHAAMLQF